MLSSKYSVLFTLPINQTCFHRYLRFHDSQAAKAKLVSADTARARHRTNVITLTGQATSFVIETVVATFALATVNSPLVFGLERVTYAVAMPILSATLAVAMFVTSPELRHHFWEG